MITIAQAHEKNAVYFGDRGHWLIVMSRSRDSDILEESNFDSALARLGGEGDAVAVERSSHWAVGWVEYLIIDPMNEKNVALAEEMHAALESYPVLDDEDYSRREHEAYLESWDAWGRGEFVQALCKRIQTDYSDGIDEDFDDDAVLDAVRELSNETIDAVGDEAKGAVSWTYQANGSGVMINVKGLAEKANYEPLLESAMAGLMAARKMDEIRNLGRVLGACEAECDEAVAIGIVTVSGYRQLMQGWI